MPLTGWHDWFPIFPTKANRWSDITDITQISPVVYEKKAGTDDQMPALTESEVSSKEFRKNWVRLIQKIYPVKFPKGNPIEQGKYC